MAKTRPTARRSSATASQPSATPFVGLTVEQTDQTEKTTPQETPEVEQAPNSPETVETQEPPVETVKGSHQTVPSDASTTSNVDSDGTVTTSPSADGPNKVDGPITGNTDADHQGNVQTEEPSGRTEPQSAVEVQSAESNKATAEAMNGDETNQGPVPTLSSVDTPFKGGEKDFSTSGSNVPRVAEPDGTIIEPGDPERFDAEVVGNFAVVKRDVYRKVYPRNALRPTFVLLYSAGQQVPASTIQRLES